MKTTEESITELLNKEYYCPPIKSQVELQTELQKLVLTEQQDTLLKALTNENHALRGKLAEARRESDGQTEIANALTDYAGAPEADLINENLQLKKQVEKYKSIAERSGCLLDEVETLRKQIKLAAEEYGSTHPNNFSRLTAVARVFGWGIDTENRDPIIEELKLRLQLSESMCENYKRQIERMRSIGEESLGIMGVKPKKNHPKLKKRPVKRPKHYIDNRCEVHDLNMGDGRCTCLLNKRTKKKGKV